ncbi:MAG: hypothetical protein LBS85_06245 [Clostridiales Family XIII bacterium]|jgi:hypothetical protein|nr:hypothetical protein [Clostridiales Family XIII bacterium]
MKNYNGMKNQNPWEDMDGFVAKCDKDYIFDLQASERTEQKRLYLDLPPQPFHGNVSRSKMLLLSLNPGIKVQHDYEEQLHNEEFLAENTKCLRRADDAKLFSLNDRFAGTAHNKWWRKCLTPKIDQEIHIKLFGSVTKYRDFLENNFSVIEFLGYHSEEAPGFIQRNTIPSQEYSFELVRKAVKEKKTILIMRGKRLWIERVSELEDYPYLTLSNAQNATVSAKNVKSPDGKSWNEVLALLLKM